MDKHTDTVTGKAIINSALTLALESSKEARRELYTAVEIYQADENYAESLLTIIEDAQQKVVMTKVINKLGINHERL